MNKEEKILLTKSLIKEIELPDYVYEKAKSRYESLGDFFDESNLSNKEPHIFSQGSFRLGTVIKPINEDDEYDLDLVCKLNRNISCKSHTQKELKDLVGNELEKYQRTKGIKEKLKSKHRCWRLEYQDDLSFHMDIVPAIQAEVLNQNNIKKNLIEKNEVTNINNIVEKTLFITDDRDKNYNKISDDWNISNPEGYAKWFENRSKETKETSLKAEAQIDDLPFYIIKSPLQRSVQILKRHRNNMFGNSDSKPISIIITTLAARAYNGENNLYESLNKIIFDMEKFINEKEPRVPNPVNPKEDFADKWSMEKYNYLNLEINFYNWLEQIKADFHNLFRISNFDELNLLLENKFSVNFNDKLKEKLSFHKNRTYNKTVNIKKPSKPWGN